MASRISERAVAICGGMLFIIFGAHALLVGVEE
jgi:putative Ca2+/H+ antiporter (TMEM165/GDT1 family)